MRYTAFLDQGVGQLQFMEGEFEGDFVGGVEYLH